MHLKNSDAVTPKKRGETCLLKVAVSSQRVLQSIFSHHSKRNAIREGPFFIWALEIKIQAVAKQFMAGRDNLHLIVILQKFKQPFEVVARGGIGRGIRHSVNTHSVVIM